MKDSRFPYGFTPAPEPRLDRGWRLHFWGLAGLTGMILPALVSASVFPHAAFGSWPNLVITSLFAGSGALALYGQWVVLDWHLRTGPRLGQDAGSQWRAAIVAAECSEEDLVGAYQKFGWTYPTGQAAYNLLNEWHPGWQQRAPYRQDSP